jgi:hypothetical protein
MMEISENYAPFSITISGESENNRTVNRGLLTERVKGEINLSYSCQSIYQNSYEIHAAAASRHFLLKLLLSVRETPT